MRTFRLVATVCVVAVLLVSLPAAAGDDRISRGDVEKTFQTYPVTDLGRIGPAQHGGTFCPEDWHVLAVGLYDVASKEVRENLQATEITILLDGKDAPATKESGIRSVLPRPSEPKNIFKHWGKFLAPGSLADGLHEYKYIAYVAPGWGGGILELGPFEFTLDSAAC